VVCTAIGKEGWLVTGFCGIGNFFNLERSKLGQMKSFDWTVIKA